MLPVLREDVVLGGQGGRAANDGGFLAVAGHEEGEAPLQNTCAAVSALLGSIDTSRVH